MQKSILQSLKRLHKYLAFSNHAFFSNLKNSIKQGRGVALLELTR